RIGDHAFFNAENLLSIFFEGDFVYDSLNPDEDSIGDDIFLNTSDKLIIDIPDGIGLKAYCSAPGSGLTVLPMGTDIESYSGTGPLVILHTPKTCFSYTENDSSVTINGLNGACGHENHNSLTIPTYINGKKVTAIADYAFVNKGIENFTLSCYVRSLGKGFLYGNEGLTDISIASIRNVDYDPSGTESEFTHNEYFELVTDVNALDESYTVLVRDEDSYGSKKLILFLRSSDATVYELPESIYEIAYGAFAYAANLKNVTLNNIITFMPEYAFAHIPNLGADDAIFRLPASVTSIATGAFYDCPSLTRVEMSRAVSDIAPKTFAECDTLEEIEWYDVDNNFYTYNNYYIFDTANGLLYAIMGERATLHTYLYGSVLPNAEDIVVMPEFCPVALGDPLPVTAIGAYAFYGTEGIDTVVVTYCEDMITIADSAFLASSIETIHFEGQITPENSSVDIFDDEVKIYYAYGSLISEYFANKNITNIQVVNGRNDLVYELIDGDTHVAVIGLDASVAAIYGERRNMIVPYYAEGRLVTGLGGEGSDFTALYSITMFENITSIEPSTFAGCSSITYAVLTDSIAALPYGLFEGASALSSVTMGASVNTIGERAFAATALTAVPVADVNLITAIADYAFAGCSMTSLTLWNGLVSIGAYAFANSYLYNEHTFIGNNISSLDIPSTVDTIGEYAFDGMSNLLYVHFQDDVANLPIDEAMAATEIFDHNAGIVVKVP
ncbi:MAG: leucine-rich repeat domain-containing protein, partial [Crenarchaeota archaeon]|nr:leucine-rich repeat domain-containing protein [Thermoproteota archaeon]